MGSFASYKKLHDTLFRCLTINPLVRFNFAVIGVVSFGTRLGAFGLDGPLTKEAEILSNVIAEMLVCFRNCMFSFPWYEYFETPTYKRFERAANTMRRYFKLYYYAEFLLYP